MQPRLKLFQNYFIDIERVVKFMSCNNALELLLNNFSQNYFSRDISEG